MYGQPSSAEMVGMRLSELLASPDLQSIDYLRAFIRSGYRLIDPETDRARRHFFPSYTLTNLTGVVENGTLVRVWGMRRDITDRKKVVERLIESENRLRTIIDSEPECVKLVSPDGTVLEMNPAGLAMVEADQPQQVVGRNVCDFVHPSYHASFISLTNKVFEGESGTLEFEIVGLKGTPLWVETNACPLRNEKGEIVAALSVTRDITDRKQAENERSQLLASERVARNQAEYANKLNAELLQRAQEAREEAEAARREWQTTFDTLADRVVIVDLEDRLIRANSGFYKQLGLEPEDCAGRTVRELAHRTQGAGFTADKCPICQLRARGERGVIEGPAGTISDYPLIASMDPIYDDAGRITAVVQVVRDLSDLYQAREEADRERTFLNATIEQMAQGLIVFDETGSVVRANRLAQEIFGFTIEEMRADRTGALAECRYSDIDGQVIAVSDLPIQTSLRERAVIETRLWYAPPSGNRVLLNITASPFFNAQDKLMGAVSLARDVTEQQRENERVQQADKLRALGQLASGVAHNFNNALAAVIGYTQLALSKAREDDLRKYLSVVEQSAKDAARMVGRIQNFSRASTHKEEFEPVKIVEIVRDAREITKPRWCDDAESLGLKYEVQLQFDVPDDVQVAGQSSELREVFVNLILNALDAMPLGGCITIGATELSSSLILSFSDNGSGMTEEIKRRVFEPFFTTKGAAGLGMGLSESYRIIERHGGRIDVESQVRRGTTFTISLPLADDSDAETQFEVVATPTGSLRVLVIDDEDLVRSVLAEILSQQGHQVMVATSCDEAMTLIQNFEFDVVFTDLAMPKTDGIATAVKIKELRSQIQVIMMSGYGADKAIERAGDRHCIDAAISKPFNVIEIKSALKGVFRTS
jgi:PAS domain S-box-containing protein